MDLKYELRFVLEEEEPKKYKVVSLDEIPEEYHNLVKHMKYPVIKDEDGTLRFKSRRLIEYMRLKCDLNDLWGMYGIGIISKYDFMLFYCEIGYGLCGFLDIWGERCPEIL